MSNITSHHNKAVSQRHRGDQQVSHCERRALTLKICSYLGIPPSCYVVKGENPKLLDQRRNCHQQTLAAIDLRRSLCTIEQLCDVDRGRVALSAMDWALIIGIRKINHLRHAATAFLPQVRTPFSHGGW